MLILEIIVVLALFVLNGFFAMAEFAIVSSRRAHLERLAKEGRPGAQLALALADDPARMLAAVQVGLTTSAMLAGIFSGATLAERLEQTLSIVPGLADYGKPISIAVMTIGVTYAALVIGELAPKFIALSNPEAIAIRVASPLAFGDNWRSAAGPGGSKIYLHRDKPSAPWRLVTVLQPGDALSWSWRADYDDFHDGLPYTVRLVSADPETRQLKFERVA